MRRLVLAAAALLLWACAADAWRCPAGTYGDACGKKCRAGTYGVYQPTNKAQTKFKHICKACPVGADSDAGSDRCNNCSSGYGIVANAVVCTACAASTFSPGGWDAVCKSCPTGWNTSPQEIAASTCKECMPGYGGPTCDLCPPNTWSKGGLAVTCQPCDGNTKSAAGSTSCNPGCQAGYGGPSCAICPPGTASAGGTYGECVTCPDGSTTLSPGSPSCSVCEPGYGGPNCAMCQPGYFSPGGNLASCVKCGPGQTSEPGAVSLDYCQCAAGYGANAAFSGCQICDIGFIGFGPPQVTAAARAAAHALMVSNYFQGRTAPVGGGSPRSTSISMNPSAAGAGTSAAPSVVVPTSNMSWLQTCKACPGDSYTRRTGSSSEDDCLCHAGSGGYDCATCPADSYSTGGSQAKCTDCPTGSSTGGTTGGTSIAACGCPPGYGGANCQPCGGTTFGPGGNRKDCVPCGPNQVSPPLATSASQCSCSPGYGGPNCQKCPDNTFSVLQLDGTTICQACPDNTVAAPNTMTKAGCRPVAGYFRDGTGTVLQCPPGWYCLAGNSTFPNGLPLMCKSGGQTSSPGSSTPDQCECKPGYGGDGCKACGGASATYSPGGYAVDCIACGDPNMRAPSLASSASQCYCKIGFVFNAGTTLCEACGPNSYYNGTGLAAGTCLDCPPNTVAPAGSIGRSSCMPIAGYIRDVSGSVIPCPQGAWCLPANSTYPNGLVELCPAGSTSPVAAVAPGQCACEPGYGGTNGCQACGGTQATYSHGGPQAQCIACGDPNARAPPEATSVSQCYCKAGYTSNPGTSICEQCTAGTFWQPLYNQTLLGAGECVECPANSNSPAGSVGARSCMPNAGYYRNSSGAVLECPPGFWCEAGTASMPNGIIHPCKTGMTSVPAAASADQCACPAGTAGDSCGACGGDAATFAYNGQCVSCGGPNMQAPPLAQSVKDCYCVSGYWQNPGTSLCEPCPANSAWVMVGNGNTSISGVCQPCPPNTVSSPGSVGLTSCYPAAGYLMVGLGGVGVSVSVQALIAPPMVATPCPLGYWCPPGNATYPLGIAIACVDGFTFFQGAYSPEQCTCLPGYAGKPCQPCGGEEATYDPFIVGSGIGGVGTVLNNPSKCVSCGDPNMRAPPLAVGPQSCYCKPGYARIQPVGTPLLGLGGVGGTLCEECPENTFWVPFDQSTQVGPGTCIKCVWNTVSPPGSIGNQSCVPAPGFVRDFDTAVSQGTVYACPEGEYCPGGNATYPNGLLMMCPGDGMTTTAGATSPADCICAPGFGYLGPNAGGCEPCGGDKATFGIGGTAKCTQCSGDGLMMAPALAKQQSDCFCKIGYVWSPQANACQQCVRNSYYQMPTTTTTFVTASISPTPGGISLLATSGVCMQCPPFTYSLDGAIGIEECYVIPGYAAYSIIGGGIGGVSPIPGIPGSLFTPVMCPPGFYCPGGNSTSPLGFRIACPLATPASAGGAASVAECYWPRSPGP